MLKLLHIVFLFLSMGYLFSQEENKNKETEKYLCHDKEEISESDHQVVINGKTIPYHAVAGTFILKDDKCKPKASMFYISYTKQGVEDISERPITFCFNGGPGSSSVWLHLGVFGPKRINFNENGDALPPYHLINNEVSLLDVSDLVFIDPVSTGYSYSIPPEEAKQFHSVEEDIKSVAEFIRLYITRYNRWESPKFIAGESYGTTRAAGLAGQLQDNYYISINGIVLVSSILNFQSIDFVAGNDLPYLMFLPSYTATAWYHKKLDPTLQANFLDTMEASRNFVINEYSHALFKGDLLSEEEREHTINQLARFTGISPEYIDRSNLRISMWRFVKELLRPERRTVGRLDSRFKGIDADAVGENFEYDPSMTALCGAFTSCFNHYVETDLKWNQDSHYKILSHLNAWDYGIKNQYLNVADTLRSVMTKNQYLRVFVGNGYYDLATPFFGTEYTFNHLSLDPSLMDHITMKYYDAGHMMYIHYPSLIKLKEDLASFYNQTLTGQLQEEKESKSVQR